MSHHISGPRAVAEPIADITDLYAFPSPERPDSLVLVLVLVLNTLPFAPPSAQFSDGLIYRFRLRPLTAAGRDDPAPFAADGEELVFDCVFSEPGGSDGSPALVQEGTWSTPSGETVPFSVNDEGSGRADGVRVFAGVRWDPFILDAPAALRTIATRKLAFTDPGSIYLDGKNVLSLVVEVDRKRVLDGGELFGVVAETLTRGKLHVRLERVGRPEVPNLMLAPKEFDPVNRDLEIRDLYNMEDAFHLAQPYLGAYRARLNANLAFWDSLDGNTDWPISADGTHPLTELLLADYLVVDAAKPYAEQGSFLEIEMATRRGEAHQTCGGRTLNDDVMDTIFTLLVNAGNGPRSAMASIKQRDLRRRRSPTWRPRIRIPPNLQSTCRGSSHERPDRDGKLDPRAGRHPTRRGSTNDRPRTSGPTCCFASMIDGQDGSSSGGCCRRSDPRPRRPTRRSTPG